MGNEDGGESRQDAQDQAVDTSSEVAGNALDEMLKGIRDREPGDETMPDEGDAGQADAKTEDEGGEQDAGEAGKRDEADAGTDGAGDDTEVQLTKRQRNAAEHFAWTGGDIKALGEKAPAMLDKLAEQRTELSRQQAEYGKLLAEQKGAGDDAGSEEGGWRDGEGDSDDSKDDAGEAGDDGQEAEGAELPGLDTLDEYAEPQEIAAAVDARVEHRMGAVHEEVAALRGEVQDFMRSVRQREADVEINRFWMGLDEAHADEYGVGPTNELPEGGTEAESRTALVKKAMELRRGQAFGPEHREMPWGTALSQALLIRSPSAQSQAGKRQGAEDGESDDGDKQDRTDQVIGKPGGKQTRTGQTTREQAGADLDKLLAKVNTSDEDL